MTRNSRIFGLDLETATYAGTVSASRVEMVRAAKSSDLYVEIDDRPVASKSNRVFKIDTPVEY